MPQPTYRKRPRPVFTKRPVSIPAKTQKVGTWQRTAVQVFFFALIFLISINETLGKSGLSTIPYISKASLHAICPFGGVVSIYEFVTAGRFVQKIHESSFILMISAFILAIGFGPVICGWVCPFGTFQEWMAKLGRKLFGKKYNRFIPEKLDNYLRYLRYAVLVLVLYATITSAKLVFQAYDPYFALFNFWSEEVALSAFIILAVTVILSLVVERPWCKYVCPYGAVLGIFNLFRIFKIRRNSASCIDCKLCDKTCPMNINVSAGKAVRNHQCISCLKCNSKQSCPVPGTVDFSTKGDSAWKIKSGSLAIVVFVLIFGSVGIASALDLWKTTGSRIPAKYAQGEFAGQADPADIRGSYTLMDISENFNIPLEDLGRAFGVEDTANYADIKCSNLEKISSLAAAQGKDIGTGSVRYFVALYKGLPIVLQEETFLPKTAVNILIEKADLTREQIQELEIITVDISALK